MPQNDIYALDAGTQSINIQFINQESYSINKNKIIPKYEENLFETVSKFLDNNIQNNL